MVSEFGDHLTWNGSCQLTISVLPAWKCELSTGFGGGVGGFVAMTGSVLRFAGVTADHTIAPVAVMPMNTGPDQARIEGF